MSWWWLFHSKARDPEEDLFAAPSTDTVPESTAGERMLDLQRAMGNRSVQRMIADSSERTPQSVPAHSISPESESLPQGTREFMENGFGEGFEDVRVHTDTEAARSAVELGANAYAAGRDIYFAPGKYAPEDPEGQRLLAHELAHVVQQSAGSSAEETRRVAASPEGEAVRAADRIAAGAPLDFALSAVRGGGPALSPADWGKDVADAKNAKDADAMAKLIETALAPMKKKVVVAKTSPGGNIDPKDYQPLPDINFDVNLRSKNSKPLSGDPKAVTATHSLATNYGYSFSDSGKKYVVLGPEALDTASPIFTRMYHDHEMYHTAHHVGAPATPSASSPPAPGPGTPKYKDEELETYTQDFLNYFHQLYGFRAQWMPLIKFYEESSATAQKSALALLKGYYNSPPSPAIATADVPNIKKAFEFWLHRRLKDSASKKLIQDLSSELGITLSAPAASSPTTTPTSAPSTPP